MTLIEYLSLLIINYLIKINRNDVNGVFVIARGKIRITLKGK